MIDRLKDLWQHRELLYNMTRKELKVKYKRSVLGFVWSFMTPLIMLAVFSLVFSILMQNKSMPWFVVYLMAGLFPWFFFVNSLMQSVGTIVNNPGLVKKVYFPREILPIAAIGANIFHFFLQMMVLLLFLVIIGFHVSVYILLAPLVFLLEALFTLGLCLLASAANVYLRDVQHFVEVATMAWFWLTPIVYQIGVFTNQFGKYTAIYLLNPMADITLMWQYVIYNPHYYAESFTAKTGIAVAYIPVKGIIYTVVLSVFLVVFGYYYFNRTDRGFAEQI